MNFLDVIKGIDRADVLSFIRRAGKNDVHFAIKKEKLDFEDYLVLLSDAASEMIEDLAVRSQQLTQKYFGKTILLYAPLYLSNECVNHCAYCGFNESLTGKRISLTLEEVIEEANILYNKGFRHILLVSGENKNKVSVKYLKEVIFALHKKFDSISLEIYPLKEDEYHELFLAGADGLTIYQEVYKSESYQQFHPLGPKSDYDFRILTPERAAKAEFYKINIGTLLGLGEWAEEAAFLGAHAAYLSKRFWRSHIAVSFPRLKESSAHFTPPYLVSDKQLVQMICALRIFLPTLGLVLSTREGQQLRDNLIPLGITQMSAESKTSPGGYSRSFYAEKQFEISDSRSLEEVVSSISCRGYDPVFKDWDKQLI